jgi:hypothetical protein
MPGVRSTCESSRSESTKWLERLLDFTEFGLRDQTAAKSLLRRLSQQLGREALTGAVVQRAPRVGRGHRPEPGAILGRHVREVQRDIGGHPEATSAPGAWQHQVHVRRERVREPKEGERRLVRDDSGALGPEPGGH